MEDKFSYEPISAEEAREITKEVNKLTEVEILEITAELLKTCYHDIRKAANSGKSDVRVSLGSIGDEDTNTVEIANNVMYILEKENHFNSSLGMNTASEEFYIEITW